MFLMDSQNPQGPTPVRPCPAPMFRLKVVVRLHILRDVHHRGGQDQLWPGFEKWGWVKTLVPCREPQVIAGIYGCE